MSVVLEARGVRKSYVGGDGSPIDVLAGVDLSVSRGEFVAIVGASGSGKSTLLHLLGALDQPSGGEVLLDGAPYAAMTAAELAALRNARILHIPYQNLLSIKSKQVNYWNPFGILNQSY